VPRSWLQRVATRTSAVLKVGLPHMEAEHEIDGLRFWDGRPTVRLLEADDGVGGMLLERCVPGTHLRAVPEADQDVVIAGLLRQIWRAPDGSHPFRPLAEMIASWMEETIASETRWPDPGLVREGLRVLEGMAGDTAAPAVLLATDLHAGNVLRASREPWLVIDPKPFVGDPAYDATQHLLNCRGRMLAAPEGTISRFADLLDVDAARIRLWMFARAAAEWREWDEASMRLARVLAR
jgi:streptomycin 6-kinase